MIASGWLNLNMRKGRIMDAQQASLAQQCLDGAYDRTKSFPDIVDSLMTSGFDGYVVDYRRGTTTYYLPCGENLVLENRASEAKVSEKFDQPGIGGQIKWAQSNSPDYTYAAFCDNMKALGCAGYIVSFPGRRVLYYGRTGETHVEHFPQ